MNLHFIDPAPIGRPAVLLLHGLGATCESWALQIPALIQSGYRPLAPDAPGFGRSAHISRRVQPAAVAAQLAELLAQAGVGPVAVVGISMGGVHALQFALDYPALVERLLLVNTFASLRPSQPGAWLYLSYRMLLVHTVGLPTQADVVIRRLFPLPEQEPLRQEMRRQILQSDPPAYRATMRALALFDATRRLSELRMPTLVVTGERDSTVPAEIQGRLVAGIPLARQVILAGAGHALTVTHSEEFNRQMLGFLSAAQNPT